MQNETESKDNIDKMKNEIEHLNRKVEKSMQDKIENYLKTKIEEIKLDIDKLNIDKNKQLIIKILEE